MPAQRPAIIGHHLIWMLYRHWLPNDPRGSGSKSVRDPEFDVLGEIHQGRIRCVERNPAKEGLPVQHFAFVTS